MCAKISIVQNCKVGLDLILKLDMWKVKKGVGGGAGGCY